MRNMRQKLMDIEFRRIQALAKAKRNDRRGSKDMNYIEDKENRVFIYIGKDYDAFLKRVEELGACGVKFRDPLKIAEDNKYHLFADIALSMGEYPVFVDEDIAPSGKVYKYVSIIDAVQRIYDDFISLGAMTVEERAEKKLRKMGRIPQSEFDAEWHSDLETVKNKLIEEWHRLDAMIHIPYPEL